MQTALKELHIKDTSAFKRATIYAALFIGCMAACVITWEMGYWPVTVALWLLLAHLGHVNLFVLHESSHYLLHPNRLLNEAKGILVGTFSLVPLAAYRHVHGLHHVHLSTSKDVEFWPYTDPKTSRWFRTFSCVVELVFGYLWTPMVFLRGCIKEGHMSRKQRRRVVAEYALAFGFWGLVIGTSLAFGVFHWVLVGYIIPMLLTGSMQTFRKFIEHMGLYGDSVDELTRTIDDKSLFGRLLSYSLLHGDIHGPHHVHAKIPQSQLPKALEELQKSGVLTTSSVYPTYWLAIKAMMREIGNPRIGPQWKDPDIERPGRPRPKDSKTEAYAV